MGLLRLGEKRTTNNLGYLKDICVKKVGWRRIAKNTCKFGWLYLNPNSDSNEIQEPWSKKGKTKVKLCFARSDAAKQAQPKAVRVLETFYNIVFLLRRIAAFLLPIMFFCGIIVTVIKFEDGGAETAAAFIFSNFIVWIACIIIENILASIAAKKLKHNQPAVKRPVSAHNPAGVNGVRQSRSADDDVITLKSAKGEDIDFIEIAGIAYGGNFYAILQPVEMLEGMDEDEALVFKVSRGVNGEDKFEVEMNDEIIDAVFAEYNRLLDEAEQGGSKRAIDV